MVNSKNAFWQALVFTILVFGIGLVFGFFLETSRSESIQNNLMNSEINLLDNQIRNKIIDDLNVHCDLAVKSSFDFADEIYSEAILLEKYDSSDKFGDSLILLHKRYDLLRTLLWIENIKLKERCNLDFHTIIYLYEYKTGDIELKSKQKFYSRILIDLKNKYPEKILLIPIAVNSNLESLELLISKYELFETPNIFVDEEKIITSIVTFNELENIVF
jgi:hypothetical protein